MEAKEPGKVQLKTGESVPPMQMENEEDRKWCEWTGSSSGMGERDRRFEDNRQHL